jgi:hypothetical protein
VQLLQLITSFSEKHGVVHAPVVVAGDMNATSLSKLRGIAGAATILAQQRTHPFLWRFIDVPSRSTSVTSVRRMRVDTILYQNTHLQVRGWLGGWLCVCVYVCLARDVCGDDHACIILLYIHTYVHTYIRTFIHTYIYAYIHHIIYIHI